MVERPMGKDAQGDGKIPLKDQGTINPVGITTKNVSMYPGAVNRSSAAI